MADLSTPAPWRKDLAEYSSCITGCESRCVVWDRHQSRGKRFEEDEGDHEAEPSEEEDFDRADVVRLNAGRQRGSSFRTPVLVSEMGKG